MTFAWMIAGFGFLMLVVGVVCLRRATARVEEARNLLWGAVARQEGNERMLDRINETLEVVQVAQSHVSWDYRVLRRRESALEWRQEKLKAAYDQMLLLERAGVVVERIPNEVCGFHASKARIRIGNAVEMAVAGPQEVSVTVLQPKTLGFVCGMDMASGEWAGK